MSSPAGPNRRPTNRTAKNATPHCPTATAAIGCTIGAVRSPASNTIERRAIDVSQCGAAGIGVIGSMASFVFRCPNTRLKVQGFVADDPADAEAFEPVICTACTRVHLVDPKSGRVLGDEED